MEGREDRKEGGVRAFKGEISEEGEERVCVRERDRESSKKEERERERECVKRDSEEREGFATVKRDSPPLRKPALQVNIRFFIGLHKVCKVRIKRNKWT